MKTVVRSTDLFRQVKSALESATDEFGVAVVLRFDLEDDRVLASMTVVKDVQSEAETTEFEVEV